MNDALSFVAPQCNMICSAAICNSESMEETELKEPGDRLKSARQSAGYETATDFAKSIGENPTSYRAYENNQNGYARKAHDFAERLGVSASWLLKGGEMLRTPAKAIAPLDHQLQKLGIALIPELELGYSMGGGAVFDEYIEKGVIPFQRNWLRGLMRGHFNDLFVAKGAGDSMTGTIQDGDIVLIDTSQKDIKQQDRIWALS